MTARFLVLITILAAACGAQNRVGDVLYWASAPPPRLRLLHDTLEHLVREQTAFFRSNGFYHADFAELDITTPPGTRVTLEAEERGWSAVARAPEGAECAVFIGTVRRIPTALGVTVPREGRILCAEHAPTPVGGIP